MKIKILLLGFVFLLGTSICWAQENNFLKDLSGLRKKIIPMCAQLQVGSPAESDEQLLNEVDNILNDWNELSKRYKSNAPLEFSKDPAWRAYFDDIDDNFQIMRQKIADKDYKRATQFCGYNCGLFVHMNQVNGLLRFTDVMFNLRKTLKLQLDMAKAGNKQGVKKLNKQIDAQFKDLFAFKAPIGGVNEKEFVQDQKILQSALLEYQNNVIGAQDSTKLNEAFKKFIAIFNKIYYKYI
jgi:hypothetical protein